MYCELTWPARDDFAAGQFCSGDAQGREPFVSDVFYAGAELSQGVYQYADGALLHALRTGDDSGAGVTLR